MGTALATDMPRDPATGLILPLSRSLGSQDLAEHRAMIALELEVLAKKLDRFGWERDRGTHAHDRLILDWMDALQDYPLDEIRAACRSAVIDRPSQMPNEGHIIAQIMAARKSVVAAHRDRLPMTREQPKAKVTKEQAEAILRDAGFSVRRMQETPHD